MSLTIHCTACNKGFNIPPEVYERRVAGKIVTLKCKGCGGPIRIDARDEATQAAVPQVAELPAAELLAAAAQPAASPAEPLVQQEPPKPVTAQPVATPPAAAQPVAKPLAAAQPLAAQPVAKPPVAAQPVAKPLAAAQPLAAQPVAKPLAAQPVAKRSAFTTTLGLGVHKPADQKSTKATNPAIPSPGWKRPSDTSDTARNPQLTPAKTQAERGPLVPAVAIPSQLSKPQPAFEKKPSPLAQSSFRRPTPAASPSAIRASRPPGALAQELAAEPAPTPAPLREKAAAPPPAPKRTAKPIAPASPPAIAEKAPSTPPPSSGPPLESLWAIDLEDSDGELTHERLISAIREGKATAETLVWRIGMEAWQSIDSLPELRVHLPPPPVAKTALPWLDEPAAVPFAEADDFDDEPTVAFQHPALSRAAKPRAPINASPPRAPALSEESVTRTQTDLFGAISGRAGPQALEASRALDALRTLNAEPRPTFPMGNPAPPVPAAPTLSSAFSSADVDEAAAFRTSNKKRLLFAAIALLALGGLVTLAVLSSGDGPEEALATQLKVAAPLPTPAPTADNEPSRGAEDTKSNVEAPRPEARPTEPATTTSGNPKAGGDNFLSMFSEAAEKADLGTRPPRPFDASEALRALKARVPFANRCAEAKGTKGQAIVAVKFAPSGQTQKVQITGEGISEITRCLTEAMAAARMPAFTGSASTASLTLSF